MKRQANRNAAEGEVSEIRDLLSYQISRTANAMSRSAALRFQQFDVSLQEWRTLALLAASGEALSLNALARAAGLDKGQMSRAVSRLVERGLVLRRLSPAGGREVALGLTRKGAALYDQLFASARERDQAFRACLNDDEQAVLEMAFRKLQAVARALSQASPSARARGGAAQFDSDNTAL